jgi:hypothetical protein
MTVLRPLVDTPELGHWLAEDLAGSEERAQLVVQAASTRVRAETGRTWIDEDTDELDDIPDPVRIVTLMLAERLWRLPTGVSQESVGSYQVSYYMQAARGLVLTADERAMLGPSTLGPVQGLWTLGTTRGELETPPVWDDWWSDLEEDFA